MKKAILSIAIISGVFFTSAHAINAGDEAKKTELINDLKSNFKTALVEQGGKDEAEAGKIVDCVGEKLSKNFTYEELKAFEQEDASSVSEEKVAEFQNIMIECFNQ